MILTLLDLKICAMIHRPRLRLEILDKRLKRLLELLRAARTTALQLGAPGTRACTNASSDRPLLT